MKKEFQPNFQRARRLHTCFPFTVHIFRVRTVLHEPATLQSEANVLPNAPSPPLKQYAEVLQDILRIVLQFGLGVYMKINVPFH